LQALTSSSSSWAISRQALHTKLFPVFEQFAHPDTQHTLILILLHALTLTVPLFDPVGLNEINVLTTVVDRAIAWT
jgi:hypothetical protein